MTNQFVVDCDNTCSAAPNRFNVLGKALVSDGERCTYGALCGRMFFTSQASSRDNWLYALEWGEPRF